MSLLYIGRIDKLEIGLTSLVNVDITNVILMNWERNHDVRPRLYANLKYPRTYQQPHSWIVGSFSLLSDNHLAIYETDVVGATVGIQAAMYEDADSNVIDFFQVTYQDENGDQRVTRFFYPIIYRYNKELLNYDDSVWIYHFLAGYAVDAEETPVEEDLLSSDGTKDSIYVHDNITDTITTSFSTPFADPRGICIEAGGNLIIVSSNTDSVYIMDGITSTVSTSFSSPSSSPAGICIDGSNNLISVDRTNDSIYIHSGITDTITTSFSSPDSSPWGVWVNTNGDLLTSGQSDDSIFIHVGITSTISTSFSSPGETPAGICITYDGNLVSCDNQVRLSFYIHDGVTSTITTSFSRIGTGVPEGLTLLTGVP